jgi:signal transduction histidine kinase
MFNIESRLSMVNATFEIGSELKKGFSMLIEVPIISDQKVVA